MGAALAVDWNEVRTLAVAIGVREAARQMGISEDAAMQRSKREGWLVKQRQHEAQVQAIQATKREEQGLSATPVSAADVLTRMGANTRAKLASVAQRAAEKLDELDGDELLSAVVSGVANQYTGMASKLHGWEAKDRPGQSGTVINIALAGLTPEMVSVSDMPLDCTRMPVESSEGLSGVLPLPDPIG